MVTQSIELPPLIVDEHDIEAFEYPISEPNYITNKIVVSEIYSLENNSNKNDINGKIVCIPQADPGFDWLFGHNIKGLITMYGGANSHMSIRSAELGIPAAIGVGEVLFDSLVKMTSVELNCIEKKIKKFDDKSWNYPEGR